MGTVTQSRTPPDYRAARQTVSFLGDRLRVRLLRMTPLRKARRDAEFREEEGLHAISMLKRRIQRELDAHPGLYADIAEPESVEGSDDGGSI
jgi:hypothetical protein